MPVLAELVVADEPELWAELGFAVEDGVATVGGVRVRLAGAGAGRGIVSWALEGVPADADLDGLRTIEWTVELAEQAEVSTRRAGEHPNGAVAIDHVVAFTGDFARTGAALMTAGLELRRTRDVPGGDGVRQGFFPLGTSLLELAGPVEGHDRAAFWGLTVAVSDIDALAARLGDRLGSVRDAVQPGRRIATLRREADSSVPLAFITPRRRGGA